MRMRILVAAALAAATLTACSSSGGGNPSGGHTGGTHSGVTSGNFCHQLAAAVHKTSGLQSAMTNPQRLGRQINPVVAAFESLKAQAPPSVASSIDQLVTAMQGAEQAIKGGNAHALRQKMMKLAPKLEQDFATLGKYVQKKCSGSGG